jgi:hypothetical protein
MERVSRALLGIIGRTLLIAFALITSATEAVAQTDVPADTGPNIWGNMPGAVVLLIPVAIGGALYLGRRLSRHDPEDDAPKREGAVSRTLARKTEDDA